MASASTSAMAELKGITECPICMEIYVDPRTLPCLHTYCFKCIEEFTKDNEPGTKTLCPVCRTEFIIPPIGVAGLRKNFFMEKMKYIRELSLPTDERLKTCDVCCRGNIGVEGKLASMYCVDCQEKMCEGCSRSHRGMKMSCQHTQVKFEDRATLTEQVRSNYPPPKCDKHVDKVLEVYCLKCKTMLCMMCYIMEHQKHDCSEVSKVAEEFRSQMKVDIKGMNDNIKKNRNMLAGINEEKERFVKKVEEVETEICKRAEKLKTLVDQDKTKLLDELAVVKNARLKQVDNIISEFQQHISIVESLKKYVHELIINGTASEVAREESVLHNRSDQLQKSNALDTLVKQLPDMTLTFRTPDKLFTGKINVVGSLESEG
jgi:hypothetical protein